MSAGNLGVLASGVLAVIALACPAPAGEDMPANAWTVVEESEDGGCTGGLVWLPEQKGVFLFGRRQRKDWRGHDISKRYWAELFRTADRKWEELVPEAGRLEAGLGRGACYTQWVKDKGGYEMPALPGYNAGCWEAHQRCWLPDQKKVLFFQGGVTFTYDPEKRTFENTGISFGKAPPDVMLGSLAWDPVGKRAILFGGGYIQAYCARPGDVKQERPADCWTPDRWDRRGTWAYDPVKNEWSKLETAAKEVAEANARLLEAGRELRSLWGATRGIAFEYGDQVLGKKPVELAALVEKFAADLAAFAKNSGGKGAGEYEKWQFSTAAGLVEKDIAAKLGDAAGALKAADGWKALRALDDAEKKLVEAQEALAVAPRARHYARLVADPENKVMVLWGGDGEDRFLADTWLLHLDTDRWERCRVGAHPPNVGSSMISMDYDSGNKVAVLAHQNGDLWAFDAAKREWKRLEVGAADKARGGTFRSLEYDPSAGAHVLAIMAGKGSAPRRTLLLRLDLKAAKVADAPAGVPEEVWRPQYGAGSGGPANKYDLAWSFLPRTQAEYRQKVAEHKKLLDAVPDNTWTKLPHVYSGFGRAYGSFCYDWDRDEIQWWGGGHSAYMGNEWSQYDLASNLWMESWNPEYPAHPHGSPDGKGWSPSFYHEIGSCHGYYNYSYSGALKKTVMWGSVVYDPDRMRYAPKGLKVQQDRPGQSSGIRVEMNGVPETYAVSARHWYGGPFGVWLADPKAMTAARLKGSDTPFGTNDRAKATFDTKRKRVLFYGAANSKEKGGKCNALWAFDVTGAKWEKLEPQVEPEGAEAPAISAWNYCYSPKHDGLLIPTKAATWFYDCEKNVMKKLECKPVETGAGVIYSPKQDLFYLLDGHGYRQQQVWVFRLKP